MLDESGYGYLLDRSSDLFQSLPQQSFNRQVLELESRLCTEDRATLWNMVRGACAACDGSVERPISPVASDCLLAHVQGSTSGGVINEVRSGGNPLGLATDTARTAPLSASSAPLIRVRHVFGGREHH